MAGKKHHMTKHEYEAYRMRKRRVSSPDEWEDNYHPPRSRASRQPKKGKMHIKKRLHKLQWDLEENLEEE